MKQINVTEFETEVIQSAQPVLVDFFTPECPPCRTLATILGEVAQERAGSLNIVKVNALTEAQLAAQFRIMTVPTLLLFQSGQCVAQRGGLCSKKALLTWLDEKLCVPPAH